MWRGSYPTPLPRYWLYSKHECQHHVQWWTWWSRRQHINITALVGLADGDLLLDVRMLTVTYSSPWASMGTRLREWMHAHKTSTSISHSDIFHAHGNTSGEWCVRNNSKAEQWVQCCFFSNFCQRPVTFHQKAKPVAILLRCSHSELEEFDSLRNQ